MLDNSLSNNTMHCQLINNKLVPYNTLSMFWNWKNAFNMAINYADSNNFEYDCYMVFRSDIINCKIPENILDDNDTIYYARPVCHYNIRNDHHINYGDLYGTPIICDAWAWGSFKVMSVYCNTYDFSINKYKKLNGVYTIINEPSLTDNILTNNIKLKLITGHNLNII